MQLLYVFTVATSLFFSVVHSDSLGSTSSSQNETVNLTTAAMENGEETHSTTYEPLQEDVLKPRMYLESEIAMKLDLYGGGLVLVVGVIGNLLSIILLRRQRLRSTTTSLYLVALAATDLVQVVIGQATRHFVRSVTGVDPPIYNTWYCKFWFYIIRVANSYSNWVLAGVSMERCIAILMPLKSKALITRKSTKIFLGLSLLFIVVYYVHSLISYLTAVTPKGKICMADLSQYFVVKIRPWSDWVLEALLPGILILMCNIIIITTLIRARAQRNSTLAEGQSTGGATKDQMSSLVIMLVSISIAYLVLTTPMHVNFVIAASFPPGYYFFTHHDAVMRLIWAVSLFMHYTNHSINFVLYVLTGREFRSELKCLFKEVMYWKKGGQLKNYKNKSADTSFTSLSKNSCP